MDTLAILLVIGLFAYGRAVRLGIVSGLSLSVTAATVQSNASADASAVSEAGPISGASDIIPNSSGFADQDDNAFFYETGGAPESGGVNPTFAGSSSTPRLPGAGGSGRRNRFTGHI